MLSPILVKSRICILLLGFILSACSAYDLGEAGDYYYRVGEGELANPPWDGVINVIVQNKCATCHTTANPWYKPKNVPPMENASNPVLGLDYIGSKDFYKAENNLLKLVKACIETAESRCGKENIPMPPSYATPLDETERKALLNYVKAIIPPDEAPQPGGLSALFLSKCEGCHPKASGYGSGASSNKKIGDSQSDTFEKYKNAFKSLAPMPSYSTGYSDADALADWKLITGK